MERQTGPAGSPVREIVTVNTLVIGSGAAGFNAALRLWDGGQKDIALLTEGVNAGTSRNTGSDKQTYYKMNLSGDMPDSPTQMAQDLFAGRCVDGDHAYAEAALSVPSFLHLAELGVPFPMNRWGEYVGYKTDHDPRTRATSAGPLTSRLMTEQLEKAVRERGVPLLDGYLVVEVLQKDGAAVGVLCRSLAMEGGYLAVCAKNLIFATGGPAGLYADTVYPVGHHGASGVLLEAGVRGKNLTEWQFGLASLAPRWNVSGTYMQVLPRLVSVDAEGVEREFLHGEFASFGEELSMLFRKGYEWPFDCRKVLAGSSRIDLLVYRETKLLGRRVYLDFRSNPQGLTELPYDTLSEEARTYLAKAGATFGTPLQRLAHMNAPAIELYRSKGVDLAAQMLEIALCAQHNNGGMDVDAFWQSNLCGLYVVGEAAGTHGVYRPGGSALNAGQCGAYRAAQYILHHGQGAPLTQAAFAPVVAAAAERAAALERHLSAHPDNAAALLEQTRQTMSRVGGAIRNPKELKKALTDCQALYLAFPERVGGDAVTAYLLKDTLAGQIVYLYAMLNYAEQGGKSRGSMILTDPAGQAPVGFGEDFRFVPDDGGLDAQVQTVTLRDGQPSAEWRPVRPLPEGGGFFENVWRGYRENGNVY